MDTLSKKIKRFTPLATILALVAPSVVFAAPANLKEFAVLIVKVLQSVSTVIFASLAVGLMYGIVLYFINSDNEQKRESIKGYLLWGVLGIIIALGVWGILAILSATLGWGAVGIPILRAPQ